MCDRDNLVSGESRFPDNKDRPRVDLRDGDQNN